MKPGTRSPVYISAPYAAPTPELRAWNAARASALARLAVAEGYAPIVVHNDIEAGVFGDDGNEIDRELGLDCDLSLLRMVASHTGGQLWEIRQDIGIRTDGQRREWLFWRDQVAKDAYSSWAWENWEGCFNRAGMFDLWESLRGEPGDEPIRGRVTDGGDWPTTSPANLELLRKRCVCGRKDGKCDHGLKSYRCARCGKVFPWCAGCGDDYFEYCDDCAEKLRGQAAKRRAHSKPDDHDRIASDVAQKVYPEGKRRRLRKWLAGVVGP